MKNKVSIIKKQKHFIENILKKTNAFIESIDKTNIETILISGSVSRGDFYPGKFGGMIDLTVMKKRGVKQTAEQIFGKNEEPNIPYHCIKRDNEWYQIAFHDFIDYTEFQKLDEAKKFAICESFTLWENTDLYKQELKTIEKLKIIEHKKELQSAVSYISYLLSDYKKNRWEQRDAFVQLHANLNTSIQLAIKSLFYINGYYSPAEDRRMYYSYSLEKLPRNYEKIVSELFTQNIESLDDYQRREDLFNKELLSFIRK